MANSSCFEVFAVHAWSNNAEPPAPILKVASLDVAEAIAAKLKRQRFTTKEGARVLRYSAVFIRETEA
jgi:hypothetical protein